MFLRESRIENASSPSASRVGVRLKRSESESEPVLRDEKHPRIQTQQEREGKNERTMKEKKKEETKKLTILRLNFMNLEPESISVQSNRGLVRSSDV